MCQGSWSMLYTPPSTPNMPKICMTWTQIMSRNVKVNKMGQRADSGKKNWSSTLVLTLTTMDICNFRGNTPWAVTFSVANVDTFWIKNEKRPVVWFVNCHYGRSVCDWTVKHSEQQDAREGLRCVWCLNKTWTPPLHAFDSLTMVENGLEMRNLLAPKVQRVKNSKKQTTKHNKGWFPNTQKFTCVLLYCY